MDLENRKNELSKAFLNNEPINVNVLLENGETQIITVDPNDENYVSSYHRESEFLNKEIQKMRLQDDYNNKRSIKYHFIDEDGQEDDIMIDANDVNYEKAYKQQLRIIENGKHASDDEVNALLNQVHKNIELDAEADKIMAELYIKQQQTPVSEKLESSSTSENLESNNKSFGYLPSGGNTLSLAKGNKLSMLPQIDIHEKQDESDSNKIKSDNSNAINIDQGLSSNQGKKCAVFRCGNIIAVIGNIDRRNLGSYLNSHSRIFRSRDKKNSKILFFDESVHNKNYTFKSSGAKVVFDANGNFKFSGADDEEYLDGYEIMAGINNDIDVYKILSYARKGQKDKIIAFVKRKGYRYVKDSVYEAIYDNLSEPSDMRDNYFKFLDIVNEAFKDNGELKIDEPISGTADDEKLATDKSNFEPITDEEVRIDESISENVKNENQKKNDELLKQAREGKITWRKFYEKYNLPSSAKKVTVKDAKTSKLNKLKSNIRNLNGLQKASFMFGIMSGIGTGYYLLNKKYAAKVNKLLFGNSQDLKSKSVKGGKR